jgi:hypothetical protein
LGPENEVRLLLRPNQQFASCDWPRIPYEETAKKKRYGNREKNCIFAATVQIWSSAKIWNYSIFATGE